MLSDYPEIEHYKKSGEKRRRMTGTGKKPVKFWVDSLFSSCRKR
jgi:hypothetical protein